MTEEVGKSEEIPQNSQRLTSDRSMREGERPFFIEEMYQGTQHQQTDQLSQSCLPCSPGAACSRKGWLFFSESAVHPGKVDGVVLCK